MIEKRSSVIQEVMEANATEAVFGQRIDAMATDVFDGSREEQHIFMETLKAMSAHSGDNCSVASDIMNFHKDQNILLNSLASSSCESSVLASNSFINNSCTISSRPACNSAEVSRSKGFVNNFSSGFFSDLYDAHVKAMKSSFEQQNFMGVALLQGSSLSVSCDDLCDELVDLNQSRNSSSMLVHHIQQPPCVIVESCNRGILSSYYHSRTKKEIDDGNDAVAVGSECIRQEVRDDSIANEAKFVTSPVSQESFAPDLLGIHVNATSAETSELPTSMKYVAEELSIMNSGSINIVSKKALIKELPERLCSHANCLLTDAGWKIEPRVRSDRSKLASYYIAPQGKRVITSLSQAWKACGRSLYSCAMNSEKETNGKEWTNIDRFWSDLTNTLSYIEENIQNNGISISHLKRWQLLDPFIAVVCINRKISVLREGKSLKAVNSTTIILSEEGDNVLADESTERVCQLEKLNASPERSLNQNPFPPAIHIDYVSITNVPGKQQTWQNCRDVQTSNRYKQQMQKPSNCAVTERKSLRCQAVCKGSNLHESRYSHHTSFKKSPCLNNEFNDSDNTLIITEEDSCCTNSKTGVDFSGQDSLPSVLETSPTNDSDPCKGTSVGKSFCHQESSIPSSPNDELLVGSGSCKRRSSEIILKEVGQKRRVISAQHRVYGKNLLKSACYGSLDLPSHSNTSTSMEVVDERLEIPPLGSKRCGNGRFPTFNHYNDLAAEKAAIGDKKNKDSGNQASGSGKKIHKKSKKISEIRVGKVNDSCDIKFTKAQKFHFDDKNECRLKFPCNQEDSHMLACKLKLECAKKSTCATGESILTRNSVKKMERSETKISKHVKDKKRFAMSLDDEVESKLIHANIDEVDIRGPKKKVCNSEGLDFQFPYQSKLLSSAKKAQHKCTEDSVVTSDDCNISTIGKSKNIQISNSVTSFGKSRDAKANPKGAKVKETEVCKKNRWKRPRGFRINDDDLLIAAIIKNKDYVSCHDKKGPKLGVSQPKKLKKFEIQKAGCKLQLRTPGKGGMPKDGLGAISGARTVLCWLIERGVLSQKDILQYRNPKNNELVKEGWITRDGILCKCCMETFSVSVFKAHCGSKHQKPSSNLFLESGRSFTLCQLQVWSAEYKARKNRMINMGAEEVDQNDDTCGLCVDGGELICCDNCPSTYHQTCLSMQDLPEGSWYCHTCICKSCGEVVKETKEDSRSLTALECSQCEHKYHDDCAKKINSSDRDLEFIAWFCGRKCKEVYLGLRTRVGILNSLADGYSWTILRCNHDDQKINSTQKIALMAECNTKLAIALSIMEECFLPMVDPRTGINMIPHVLYNWGSNFIRLNYQGFYTVVLEKGDEIISVASIRVHGVTVAEMPLVATSSEHRRQGMCRRLIDALEKMLRSFKVQMLVLSAIPGLVETWTSHFGFKQIGDAERRMLNHVNLMLFPGTELLIKYLGEAKVEESGSDTGSLLRSSQCSNPDGFSETVLKTTVQAEEIAKTGTHDGALFPTPDAVYLRHEEHDCQQKDILISFCDTDKTTPKPNDNYNMPDPLWSKEENLHSDEPGTLDSTVQIKMHA